MKKFKFQLILSKIMPAWPKKRWDIGCQYHYIASLKKMYNLKKSEFYKT